MTDPVRFVQVGTGGMGEVWCRRLLPPFQEDGRIDVVAAVDIVPDALIHAREGLGLPPQACYQDLESALRDHEADVVSIVVPPAYHEAIVDIAIEHRMDILSEKPITDTLASSARVVEKVRVAGVRMGVTMNHRFDVDKVTFTEEIVRARNGRLDYLVGQFTQASRGFAQWGRFRHEMADPMLVEGSVHHLDFLVAMAGAPCTSIWATTWRPAWAEYAGDTNVLAILECTNGVRVQYEAATATAVSLNGWSHEYVRAESEFATLILDRREVRRYPFDADAPSRQRTVPYDRGEVIERPTDRISFGHARAIEDFLSWRDGGPPMATAVDANLRSMMLVAGAIESSQTGNRVDIRSLLPPQLLPPEYVVGYA